MSTLEKPTLALFDFDGTITDEDMFTLFLHYSASGIRKWLGKVIILPFYALYKVGVIPAKYMRPIACFIAFAGRNSEQIKALGNQFAHDVIPLHIRPQAAKKLDWHQQRGDTIVIVSASLNAYLKPWCKTNRYQLLCSEIGLDNKRISGIYHGGDCSLMRKVTRIKSAFELYKFDQIYAYGDTHEDIAMLSLADHAMFNWLPWNNKTEN